VSDGLVCASWAVQELFNIESYAFKTLTKAQETFERQNSLWKMILKWNEQTEHWMADDFTKVDVEEMNRDVGVYFKDAFALHKKMNNDVTAKLKDAVADLKVTRVEESSEAHASYYHALFVCHKFDMYV
jgi:hypothetical protein